MSIFSTPRHAKGLARSTWRIIAAAVGSLVAAVLTVALVAPAEAAPIATATLTPPAQVVRIGQTVTLDVAISLRGAKTHAVQTDLSFPSSAFDCATIDVNQGAWPVTAEKTCKNGHITIAVGSFTARDGNQVVGRVTLKAKKAGTSTVAFVPETQVLENQNHTAVPLRTMPARVVVLR